MYANIDKIKSYHQFRPGAAFVPTHLPEVRFFWSTESVPRAPLIYNAGLVIILQGHKTGYLDNHQFHYNDNHYLLLSTPIPFECETSASPEHPLLGLFIAIDRADLMELAQVLLPEEKNQPDAPEEDLALGVRPVLMDDRMKRAIDGLLDILCSPGESAVLGKGSLKEILYHALKGPHGGALKALGFMDPRKERIGRTVERIRRHYGEALTVEDLADQAGMSLPVFHKNFKDLTGASPLQYLKKTRLHRAKDYIISEGLAVSEAAERVGYADPSHFSREFKRYFQVSPKEARKAGYGSVDI